MSLRLGANTRKFAICFGLVTSETSVWGSTVLTVRNYMQDLILVASQKASHAL